MSNINGYIVLHLPEKCRYFIEDKIGWRKKNLVSNSMTYRGVDRSQWEEVSYAFFYSDVSEEIKNIYKNIRKWSREFVNGTAITQNLEDAVKILKFSNHVYPDSSEIIAIHSEVISSVQGEFEAGVGIYWIGYDLVGIGEWSMIEHGVIDFNPMFQKWKHHLNQYGLFPEGSIDKNWKLAKELIKDYKFYAAQNLTEPMDPDDSLIDLMHIGLVT
ncbi:MAG: hypothetical protein Tsb0021_01880 [Chlamydiales bacterium]